VLRQSGRSMLVEATEDFLGGDTAEPVAAAVAAPADAQPIVNAPADEEEDITAAPQSVMSMQDGVRAVQHALGAAARWPMYVRQAKQFLKNNIEGFDERKYGFASVVDLLRAAGKEGVLRIERDRQGAIRVFPGENMAKASPASVDETGADAVIEIEAQPVADGMDGDTIEPGPVEAEVVLDTPIVDGVAVLADLDVDTDADADDVNGNIAGVATHEMTTVAARRRRSAPRPKTVRPAAPVRAAAPPRRGVKKTTRRQKPDAK
jgi:hypothetical protein